MSAIGIYVQMRASDLDRCAGLAEQASAERPFRWPWQPRAESGFEIFAREWAAAILDEVTFGESGHLLTSYFLAQTQLNQLPDPFDSAESKRFERVFTAAFLARSASRMPEMPAGPLASFCASEWGTDASGMVDGLSSAHQFLNQGLARATATEPIVFIIA